MERDDIGRVLTGAWVVVFLALLAVLLADTLAGDDAASGAPPPEDVWADAVCTEVAEWREALEDLVGDVGLGDLVLRGDGTVRDLLIDGASVTAELVGELRAIGLPDTAAVEAARPAYEAFLDELDDLHRVVSEAGEEIEGPRDLLTVGGALLTEAREAAVEAWSAFHTLRREGVAGELRRALGDSAVCRTLDDGLL